MTGITITGTLYTRSTDVSGYQTRCGTLRSTRISKTYPHDVGTYAINVPGLFLLAHFKHGWSALHKKPNPRPPP